MASTRNQPNLTFAPSSPSNSHNAQTSNHQHITKPSVHAPHNPQHQPTCDDHKLPLSEDEETEFLLFIAGVMRLADHECKEFMKCHRYIERIKELHPQAQQLYQQNQKRLFSEVALRQKIEQSLNATELTKRSFVFDMWVIRKVCGRYLTDRDAFRNAMKSRFVQRIIASLLNLLQMAVVKLLYIIGAINMRLADIPFDGYDMLAHEMATVQAFFISEYNKYATGILTSDPTDEEKAKLSSRMFFACFRSKTSLVALFSHIQYMRNKLQQTEQMLLDTWRAIPTELVNKATWNLALLNDVVHNLRRICMTLVAPAMRFVDDEDQFFQYCRSQEDRVRQTANNVHLAQRRLQEVTKVIPNNLYLCNHSDVNASKEGPSEVVNRYCQSMPVVLDAVEERIGKLDPLLIPGSYNVFVGHDNTEDCLEMVELVAQRLNGDAISTYAESVIDVDHIPLLSEGTERALYDACVGVFFLSADLAKKRSKVEQLRIMLQRVRDARLGWPGLVLIPVFYKLTVAECRYSETPSETIGGGRDEEVRYAREIFKDITGYTGIENVENVAAGDSEEMKDRRFRLVDRICEAVVEACMTARVENLKFLHEANGEDHQECNAYLKELKARIMQSRKRQQALLE